MVNSAAGLNHCASELQEWITSTVALWAVRLTKARLRRTSLSLSGTLKYLLAFHHNVSLSMDTALQHLADSLFVHHSNLILLQCDSYLEHVKPGIKPDTWNVLQNAPGYVWFWPVP